MSPEEVDALGDEVLSKAYYPPKSLPLAVEIFSFLQRNIGGCVIGGFDAIIIDRDKLERLAERRDIDLTRYEPIVDKFIKEYKRWQLQQSQSDLTRPDSKTT